MDFSYDISGLRSRLVSIKPDVQRQAVNCVTEGLIEISVGVKEAKDGDEGGGGVR